MVDAYTGPKRLMGIPPGTGRTTRLTKEAAAAERNEGYDWLWQTRRARRGRGRWGDGDEACELTAPLVTAAGNDATANRFPRLLDAAFSLRAAASLSRYAGLRRAQSRWERAGVRARASRRASRFNPRACGTLTLTLSRRTGKGDRRSGWTASTTGTRRRAARRTHMARTHLPLIARRTGQFVRALVVALALADRQTFAAAAADAAARLMRRSGSPLRWKTCSPPTRRWSSSCG